jgi:hypothetical protein
MIFKIEDSVEMIFSDEDQLQLIDPSFTAENDHEHFTLVIASRGLLMGKAFDGLAVITSHVAVISSSLGYILENMAAGIALEFQRQGAVDSGWVIDFTHLKICKGAVELFSIPFVDGNFKSAEARAKLPKLIVEDTEVVGADLANVLVFSRLVPGASERKLRGQLLEISMGL